MSDLSFQREQASGRGGITESVIGEELDWATVGQRLIGLSRPLAILRRRTVNACTVGAFESRACAVPHRRSASLLASDPCDLRRGDALEGESNRYSFGQQALQALGECEPHVPQRQVIVLQ